MSQILNAGGQSGHRAPRWIELVAEPVPFSAVEHRPAWSSAASWSRAFDAERELDAGRVGRPLGASAQEVDR